jgi:transcriptional regulator with XRE-family HTH domain
MAEQLGINAGYLSELENGNRANPTLAVFDKISTRFNVSLDYLVRGTGNMFLPGNKANGRDHIKDVRSLDDVYWLIDNSLLFKDALMSMAARIFYENEDFINENIKRSRNHKED